MDEIYWPHLSLFSVKSLIEDMQRKKTWNVFSGDTQTYELVKTKLLSDAFSLKGVLAVHQTDNTFS